MYERRRPHDPTRVIRFLDDLSQVTAPHVTGRATGRVIPMDVRSVAQADGMPSVVGIPPHRRCGSAFCEECTNCQCTATTGEGCPEHDPYAATRAMEQEPERAAVNYAPRWHAFLGVPDDA